MLSAIAEYPSESSYDPEKKYIEGSPPFLIRNLLLQSDPDIWSVLDVVERSDRLDVLEEKIMHLISKNSRAFKKWEKQNVYDGNDEIYHVIQYGIQLSRERKRGIRGFFGLFALSLYGYCVTDWNGEGSILTSVGTFVALIVSFVLYMLSGLSPKEIDKVRRDFSHSLNNYIHQNTRLFQLSQKA